MYPILENRPTWIEVDLQQFDKNLGYLRSQSQNKEIWAVVKSDAYNHGITGLFTAFVKNGITKFCVGQYDEALQLQQIANEHQQKIELLIFGYVPLQKLLLIPHNWHITIADMSYLNEILKVKLTNSLSIHMKIDSGMNRRGFKNKDEFLQALKLIENSEYLRPVGIYTHFSTASNDLDFMNQQTKRFSEITKTKVNKFKYIHAQNSFGILNLLDQESQLFNLVRPGGICYGMIGKEHPIVKPIFNLYTKVIEKKTVKVGDVIGYGNTYCFDRPGFVGILPIGYADGLRMKNTGLAVFVNDTTCHIVGAICMEQCMVFSENDSFNVGDTVELIGVKQNVFDVAAYNQISDYELVLSFLQRIPRKYIDYKEEKRYESKI